jgi:pimeloyl-[acyl-carrier protein] methyl ester esterase
VTAIATKHGPQQGSCPSVPDRELPLILLPGLDGEGFSFGPLLEQLPPFVRPTVVAFPRDRAMGYEELLPLVMGMLPQTPFVLLGESFSSPLSIAIAAARPAGLRGLILCSAFARNPLWLAPNWLAHLTHPLVFRLYDPYVRIKVWRRGGGPKGDLRLAALNGQTPEVIATRCRSALRVNVMEQLASCQVPVIYVRGERDRLIHRRNLLEMTKCLPSMRVAMLDGGHCILRSRTPLAVAAIVEFMKGCDWSDADR